MIEIHSLNNAKYYLKNLINLLYCYRLKECKKIETTNNIKEFYTYVNRIIILDILTNQLNLINKNILNKLKKERIKIPQKNNGYYYIKDINKLNPSEKCYYHEYQILILKNIIDIIKKYELGLIDKFIIVYQFEMNNNSFVLSDILIDGILYMNNILVELENQLNSIIIIRNIIFDILIYEIYFNIYDNQTLYILKNDCISYILEDIKLQELIYSINLKSE